ncbi:hypothetical protein BpHYR1_048682 [Brachionus plicatilis]|uniref:Uncharacterized protein n=1 Tax=Brachionus plicatilis TaxID=10195 RepID=A0A3M7S4L8_BRAPC|nr:hypothetical protein BpHYR1_048682 [Brachionus plicatilis]
MSELENLYAPNNGSFDSQESTKITLKTELDLDANHLNTSDTNSFLDQSINTESQILTKIETSNDHIFQNGVNYQKVYLEDLNEDMSFNTSLEDSMLKQFKFQILYNELKNMVDNSVHDPNSTKPYRYLTGNFIKVFEKHVENYEKMKIPIQKRNNVVYEESSRNNTVYLRINGDCKLCPKENKVRYVFIVRKKPDGSEKFVDVEAKSRGIHYHTDCSETFTRKKRISAMKQDIVQASPSNEKSEDGDRLNLSLDQSVNFNFLVNPNDRVFYQTIANQVNQISDRLYDLEKKLETYEKFFIFFLSFVKFAATI